VEKQTVVLRRFWSLIELTVILVVLSILCAILAPVVDRYLRNARVVRAREDVQALGVAVVMFIEDTANSYFLIAGTGGGTAGGASRDPSGSAPDQSTHDNRVSILVSDGDVPEVEATSGGADWSLPVNLTTGLVDFLENHLVLNKPGGDVANAYRTPTDLTNPSTDLMFARSESGGFNSEFAWRGPYITGPIDPDPWGNRYAVNVRYLDARSNTVNLTAPYNGFEEDVVVISAGPDEEIDTDFDVDGLTPGDDDIIYTLSANSRP